MRPEPPPPPADGEPLRAGHVLAALADRLPRDAILLEETPSSRPELHARVPATAPLGFISAMGMLGFALPAAIGVRMARADRPVLAVVGDGSSLYQITALWTAASYGVGTLIVVLVNGGYAIMDRLAERNGSRGPWPRVDSIDIGALARAQGCASERISTHDELLERFDALLPGWPTATSRCCSRSSSRRTRPSTRDSSTRDSSPRPPGCERRVAGPRTTKAASAGRPSQAPGVGFEPTTLRLTAECSAVELPRTDLPRIIGGRRQKYQPRLDLRVAVCAQ